MFEYEPRHIFAAWRRGKRSRIGIVTAIHRQELADVDLDPVHDFLFFFLFGHVVPQFVYERIVLAFLEENCDDYDVALLVLVNQVDDHLILFPINPFLARLVKVELRKVARQSDPQWLLDKIRLCRLLG